MSKGLSKESEAQVLSAVSDLCDDVADGDAPTEALKKVAVAGDFPPDMIRLIAVGYNTGAVNHQRSQNKTALAKFASIPVADAEQVIGELYPPAEEEETPGVKAASAVVSPEYASAPRSARKPNYDRHEKAANDKRFHETRPKVAAYQPENRRVDLLLSQTRSHKRALEELRYARNTANDQFVAALGRFSNHFAKLARERPSAIGELRYLVRELYGPPGELAIKYAAERASLKLDKLAAPVANTRPADLQAEPLRSLALCLSKGAATQQAERVLQEKQAEFLRADIEAAKPLVETPTVATKTVLSSGRKVAADASAREHEKLAGGLVGMLIASNAAKNLFSDAVKPPETASLVNKYTEDLADPNHENELRAIQAETMLQDFINNDEVLSGHDPGQVMRAYNELSQLSPRAATQPAVMRPLLRKYLSAGGLETFESGEMANIEKTLAQTRTPSGANNYAQQPAAPRR